MSYKKHTWSVGGETVTTSLIDGHINWFDADNAITTAWEAAKPKRIRCEYCGCLSDKDYGTCEHCGAAL